MPCERITSRNNDRVRQAKAIAAQAAQRAKDGLFFAEGVRLCFDLAENFTAQTAFFTSSVLDKHPETETFARENFLVSESVAQKLSETKTTQGLFCLFKIPAADSAALASQDKILLCDSLQDPANVGAVLRSAAAFGFGAAVLSAQCADPYSPKALRASMGAIGRLAVRTHAAMDDTIRRLHENKVTVYAAALQAARPLANVRPQKPLALLIGNEGAGLPEEYLALADALVCIPMAGGVESLNAAVAASIIMYVLS